MSVASREREAERNRGRFGVDGLTALHRERQGLVEEHTRGIVVHPGMVLRKRNFLAEQIAMIMALAGMAPR